MIYFSEWLKKDFSTLYNEIVTALDKHGAKHGLLPHTKDYWCRDYMPIPLADGRYMRYQYSHDYLNDSKDRNYITNPKPVSDALDLSCIDTDIILDGGNIVRCGDKIVMIDKVFKENPQYKESELITELEELLKAKIVWLPWDKNEKYGHSDGVLRYIGDGKVLLTNDKDYDANTHERFHNILSEHFTVEELSYTQPSSKDNSQAYINFLQTDNVIILPKYGTHKDAEALAQIEQYFPKYKGRIEQVDARGITKKGGAFNCISWNII